MRGRSTCLPLAGPGWPLEGFPSLCGALGLRALGPCCCKGAAEGLLRVLPVPCSPPNQGVGLAANSIHKGNLVGPGSGLSLESPCGTWWTLHSLGLSLLLCDTGHVVVPVLTQRPAPSTNVTPSGRGSVLSAQKLCAHASGFVGGGTVAGFSSQDHPRDCPPAVHRLLGSPRVPDPCSVSQRVVSSFRSQYLNCSS